MCNDCDLKYFSWLAAIIFIINATYFSPCPSQYGSQWSFLVSYSNGRDTGLAVLRYCGSVSPAITQGIWTKISQKGNPETSVSIIVLN